jgi:hypothetical protein
VQKALQMLRNGRAGAPDRDAEGLAGPDALPECRSRSLTRLVTTDHSGVTKRTPRAAVGSQAFSRFTDSTCCASSSWL